MFDLACHIDAIECQLDKPLLISRIFGEINVPSYYGTVSKPGRKLKSSNLIIKSNKNRRVRHYLQQFAGKILASDSNSILSSLL